MLFNFSDDGHKALLEQTCVAYDNDDDEEDAISTQKSGKDLEKNLMSFFKSTGPAELRLRVLQYEVNLTQFNIFDFTTILKLICDK